MFSFLLKLLGIYPEQEIRPEPTNPTMSDILEEDDEVDLPLEDYSVEPLFDAALASESEPINDEVVKQEEPKEIQASITFTFDNAMGVKIDSKVSPEFVPVMVKNNVIKGAEAIDKTLVHYALVVLANEASEQFVMSFEDNSDDNLFNDGE